MAAGTRMQRARAVLLLSRISLLPEIRKHKTLVTLKFYSLGDNRTKVTLSHTGWGEGEEWDEVYNYFVSAWGDVVLPNLKKVVSSQK